MLTHGSLFSGIGGFDIGADRERIKTLWNCEIEPYQRNILAKHFPNTLQYEDIKQLTNPGHVDIISGGFPCQDISLAGKGKGIKGERSGLWTEYMRIIRYVEPRYAIIENSPALTFRGLENILCDLSDFGYNAEWQCLSNAMFGFPHQRKRLYIIAYTNKNGLQTTICKNRTFAPIFRSFTSKVDNSYLLSKRIYETPNSNVIRVDDGFRNWTQRVSSIGNSVNPTVAQYIFKCIKLHLKECQEQNRN